MKISIIGASKGVGLQTVKRGLERNHNITTLSRSNFSIPASKRLNKIIGDATNKNDLQKAFQDVDGIIIALGTNNSTKATTLYTEFAKTLLSIHQENPIQVPIVILTGFGAGDSHPYLPFYLRWVFNIVLKDVYKNKTAMEDMIMASSLPWTIVRPGILTNEALTEKYQIETKLHQNIQCKFISRLDVGDYMIKEIEHQQHLRTITYLT